MDRQRRHTARRELNHQEDRTVEDTPTEDIAVEDAPTADLVEALPEAVGAGETRAGAERHFWPTGAGLSMAFVTSGGQVGRIHCFSNGAWREGRGRLKLPGVLYRDAGRHELHPYGQGGPGPGLLGA